MGDADVVVIGAGAAGLAAARFLQAHGVSAMVLEAKDRIGGRAWTTQVAGRAGVDVGAHWLHASRWNPLAKIAARHGITLLEPDDGSVVLDDGRPLTPPETAKLWRAWSRVDSLVARRAEKDGTAAADRQPSPDRYMRVAASLHGTHACGMPLADVSARDFNNALDYDDRFVAGGYGALVARLGDGLAVKLATPIDTIDLTDKDIRISGPGGSLRCKAVLVTVSTAVLAAGRINFVPGLPPALIEAAEALRHGAYERLVFSLADDMLGEGQDRAIILFHGDALESDYILAGGGGPGLHFCDLGGPEGKALASAGLDAMEDRVRELIRRHLGAGAAAGLVAHHASNWSGDPHVLGAWSVARPGRSEARAALQTPIDGRLWLTGEATSRAQWGTVGGAYLEGERAAREIVRALG